MLSFIIHPFPPFVSPDGDSVPCFGNYVPLGALYAMSSGDNACMICNSCSSSVRNQSLCFCCSAIASFYSVLSIYLSTFCQRRVNLYFLSISRHCLFFVHDKCGTKTYVYMSRNSQIYISHTRAHIKYTYTCTYKIHTHMHIQNSHTHTYRIHIHTYKTPPPTQ